MTETCHHHMIVLDAECLDGDDIIVSVVCQECELEGFAELTVSVDQVAWTTPVVVTSRLDNVTSEDDEDEESEG